jgi:hypothetical protein
LSISNPTYWRGFGEKSSKADQYNKILEIIAGINKTGLLGSANSAFIPCFPTERGPNHWASDTTALANQTTGATVYMPCYLPMPTSKGSLNLFVKDIKIEVTQADSNDFVDTIWVRRISGGTVAHLSGSPHDVTYNSSGTKTLTRTADNVGSYTIILVVIIGNCNSVGGLRITPPLVECYYV